MEKDNAQLALFVAAEEVQKHLLRDEAIRRFGAARVACEIRLRASRSGAMAGPSESAWIAKTAPRSP